MTDEQKRSKFFADMAYYENHKHIFNYELRLYSTDDYASIEYCIENKDEFLELVDYANFIMDRPQELLNSVVFGTMLEQETPNGVKYWPTWGLDQKVCIDLNDISDLNFNEWRIVNTNTDNDVAYASGHNETVFWLDIDDPIVGKYATIQELKVDAALESI